MILGIIVGLIILVFLVVVHELGHAIVARKNGVIVEEFGVGFPPKAWAKKLKNGILLTLNWLPLGGFVRLKGESDAAKSKGSFGAATFWQKTKILYAGVVMNWLVAIVLLTILAWTGLPKILPNQFEMPGDTRIEASKITLASIVEGGAAQKAGFLAGDELLRINADTIDSAKDFIAKTKDLAGQNVTIDLVRDSQQQSFKVDLAAPDSQYIFGAGVGESQKIYATWSAPIVGIVTTGQLSWETLSGLGGLISNLFNGFFGQFSSSQEARSVARQQLDQAAGSVAGPVGILGVIFPSAQSMGLTHLVLLTAIISLTLAVMNALPIPALDGGRWWTIALFKLFGKKLTKQREESIQAAGFLILMALIILVTIADIGKL